MDPSSSAADLERETLLEPFIAAVCTAFGEMANTAVEVTSVRQSALRIAGGEVTAVVRLAAASEGLLALSFPEATAAALAGRILADVATVIDANLVRDCVGEIANVVAGQAKAMLAETVYAFSFSLPEVVSEFRVPADVACLQVVFASDCGEFFMQVFLKGPCEAKA